MGVVLDEVLGAGGGEIRMPVREAPIASATAVAVSKANRIRFSTEPPKRSSRRLAFCDRNWWIR
nr:hypothetical protein GCM10020093_088630 [Planobispora longispora]